MDSSILMWIWMVSGLLLLASELVVPGMITGFLGAGALTTAALMALGVVDSVTASLFTWMGSSTFLVITLRRTLLKRFPSSTSHTPPLDDAQLCGMVVEVVAAIDEDSTEGRIRLHGTTWPARASQGKLAVGSRARLVFRDNLAWTVEPVGELEPGNTSN